MKTRLPFAAALALGLTGGQALAQEDQFANIEIGTTEVGHGIYMLEGVGGFAGGNIGVSIGEDGVFMIDDQLAPMSDKIKAAVAKLTDQPIKYIINTHWHGDHRGGNGAFAESGSVIVSHKNVRVRMMEGGVFPALNMEEKAVAGSELPVITFTDEMTFHFNGLEAHIIHSPHAHTDGDAIIHFIGADIIHMGDTLFNGMYPFIDLRSGGNLNGFIAAQDLVLSKAGPATKIIPGHGQMTDKAGLKKYRDMLVEVRSRVQKAINEGKSLTDLQGSGFLADISKDYGGGFIGEDRMIEFVYRSLKPE